MREKHIVCIGAALIDESFVCSYEPLLHTSNPAVYYRSAGGVARNVAHHLALLGNSVELITHFGNDEDGKWIMDKCTSAGISLSNSIVNNLPTGHYAAIITPGGELFIGSAALHFETAITAEFLKEKSEVLKSASLIQMDCNLNAECLNWLLDFCRNENKACVIETVSVTKAARLLNANLKDVLLITPNHDELQAITNQAGQVKSDSAILHLLDMGIQNIWIRNGKDGSKIYNGTEIITQTPNPISVIDVTGAGDAALAGWIHAYLLGKNITECLNYGQVMAELILQTKGAVLDELTIDLLESKIKITVKNNI